jgi:hypothetical protein
VAVAGAVPVIRAKGVEPTTPPSSSALVPLTPRGTPDPLATFDLQAVEGGWSVDISADMFPA